MINHTTEQTPQNKEEQRGSEAEQKPASIDWEKIDQATQNTPPPEEEEELDDLQQRVRDFPDKKWNIIQYISGTAVGFLCGALVTYFPRFESIGSYGTIAALVIAIFAPRLVEKRVKRSVQKGRVSMLISLAVWIAVTALIMFAQGVPFFA